MFNIIIFLIPYLLCSLNPAIFICKKISGEDIRKLGSGNAGTTNITRVLGRDWGALVFILDISKVLISYGLVYFLYKVTKHNFDTNFNSYFLLASFLGHTFPIFHSFKGGKGMVVLIVNALLIDYKMALVCIVVGVIIILVTRIVSLASLCGSALFLIMTIFMMPSLAIPVAIVVGIIFFKHRENIERIKNNQENKIFN